MGKIRNYFLLILNVLALVAILIWTRNHISVAELFAQFKALPAEGVLAALVLNVVLLGVYGLRLSLLLSVGWFSGSAVSVIGFGMNGVLPFRLGELAKLAYAQQFFHIASSRLIAATATEKLMDLSALLIVALIISKFIALPLLNQGIAIAGLLVGGLTFAIIVASFVIARWENSGRRTYTWISSALDTLRAQSGKARVTQLALLTSLIWAITVISIYWMFSLVFPEFSIFDAGALTFVLAMAIAIPSAPAGLGIFEATIVAYLQQVLGAEPNKALAVALTFHLLIVIPQVFGAAGILTCKFFVQRSKGN